MYVGTVCMALSMEQLSSTKKRAKVRMPLRELNTEVVISCH